MAVKSFGGLAYELLPTSDKTILDLDSVLNE